MKSYIWSLPTRIFHWLLAIGFIAAYLSGQFDGPLSYHSLFGMIVCTVLVFRIIWGFIGPQYSRFSDFPISINSIINFAKGLKDKHQIYSGHNPLASLVMLSIIIAGILTAFSGMMIVATEGYGLLFMQVFGGNEDLWEEFHEICANLFLFLVIMHLIGIIVDLVLHKSQGALTSIFTGYKNIETQSIKLTAFQKSFSIFTLIVILIIGLNYLINPIIENENKSENNNEKIEHSEEEDD